MKTSKLMMLLTASLLTASISFAQVGLGVANTTKAAVHLNASTQAATNAATKAAVAAKNTVSATTSKAAQVKASASNAGNAALSKGAQLSAKDNTSTGIGLRTDARTKGALSANANVSDQAKAHANENSVLGSDANVSTSGNTNVKVDGKKLGQDVKTTKGNVKTEVAETKDKAQSTADNTKAEVKTEARARSQAAVKASEKAKEHANGNSALFGAKNENSASQDVKADKSGISSNTSAQSKTQLKASKQ